MNTNLQTQRDNSEIFRDRIYDFSNLCLYTQKVLDEKIPYECYQNGNIVTDKICYHSPCGKTFYITERKCENGKDVGENLFWEKQMDQFNWWSSAGKLSRLVRKLFNQSSLKSESVRYSRDRINQINNKINRL